MDNEKLSKLRSKLICADEKTFNLEKTRQWVVLPFLHALGYDIMSDEVEPTYVDAKKGYNKYDFTLRVDGTRIALIKCKSFKEMFMPADIDMLSNSFHDKKVSLAILTNGYEYQFYRKEPKSDFMEKHPFCSLDMSLKLDDIMVVAEPFARENISTVGMEKITGLCDVRSECKLLERQLGEGTVPEWLAKTIIVKAKAVGVKPEAAADMLLETFKSLTNLGKIELERQLEDAVKHAEELQGKLSDERNVLNNKVRELSTLHELEAQHSVEIKELREALAEADKDLSEKSSELVRLMVMNGDLTEEVNRLRK